MGDIVSKFVLALFAFLKEVFINNPTYQRVIKRNKQLITVSFFCLILFLTLLFNVEKTLEIVKNYKALEVEYSLLKSKYEIMTNVYGENASDDPEIVREIFACRGKIKQQEETIIEHQRLLAHKDRLIHTLQNQLMAMVENLEENVCE
jgi:hypothetical protein